jgi:dolichyl-phosphate beta-glucosyltransferase
MIKASLLILIISIILGIILWIIQPAIELEVTNNNGILLPTLIISSDNRLQYIHEYNEIINDNYDNDITIVIPAYNEEIRMPIMLDSTLYYMNNWCHDNNITYEILIVDDGSTDGTLNVATNYMINNNNNNNIRVLKLNINQGKGEAVKVGVLRSKGKYILMADADGATDIKALPKLYDSLKSIENNQGLGVAIGSRAHLENKAIATRAFYRTILMRGFHIAIMLLISRNIKDTQCGFKFFTRNAAKQLFSGLHLKRWAFDVEIIYRAEKFQIPMKEVAVSWQEIEGSKLIRTKFDIIKTSLSMARDMLCVRVLYLLKYWK